MFKVAFIIYLFVVMSIAGCAFYARSKSDGTKTVYIEGGYYGTTKKKKE